MLTTKHGQLDLTVKGETIERIYSGFITNRYVVNRRYQRKLVWGIDEKRDFIDSVASNFPVPIILLADPKIKGRDQFEIIDGMQRLNAVISFIENEFSWRDAYFDLNALAVTKSLLDSGKLEQQVPILDRQTCVQIASYQLPLSIFESAEREDIEEVFRRINSGGRKLSRQELRIAGSTGEFANSVRKISALIRGDVSDSDIVLLNKMKEISITSKSLSYGIDIDSIFWVKNGILTKDQVRESRDEEIVADMMAYMVSDTPPPSRSEYLDAIFGFKDSGNSGESYSENEEKVRRYTSSALTTHFQKVYDELRLTIERGDKTLGEILFKKKVARAPRYFQVVFLAFFDQLIKQRKSVSDRDLLLRALNGVGGKINITDGGSWGAQDRFDEVKRTSATISQAFVASKEADPTRANWINQLETILTSSIIEQSAYDFKQGFLRLDNNAKFDEDNFEKILQTIVGISNIGQGRKGYVIVGIVDKEADAQRVKALYGVDAFQHRFFRITGVGHEAKKQGVTIDEYFRHVVAKLKSRLDGSLKTFVLSNIKLINYYDKNLIIIDIEGQEDPSNLDGVFYIREGNNLSSVAPIDFVSFMKSYPRIKV